LPRIGHEKFVHGYFAINSASLLESVTGALQVKFSHTYAADEPGGKLHRLMEAANKEYEQGKSLPFPKPAE
jgi:hypothetical protein